MRIAVHERKDRNSLPSLHSQCWPPEHMPPTLQHPVGAKYKSHGLDTILGPDG
ncbi:hypothetical protein E8E15_000359 [Penicillium rubens]|nr:hypothetical protein E8E15_000359 [Penicillium rubens]